MDKAGIQWDIIAKSIEDEKCILFLGSEIFSTPKGKSFSESLLSYLDKEKGFKDFKYYPNDHLFHFNRASDKTILLYHLEDFYTQVQDRADAIYHKIAEIPFPFIISLNTDERLIEVMKEAGVEAQYDFYWKKRQPDDGKLKPSKSSPVVYNIFGSVKTSESMIITYDDLFSYTESLLQTNPLPDNLRKSLQTASSFIFLGVRLNRWFVQMLLRFLSFHNESPGLKYAYNLNLDETDASFCSEQLNIDVIQSDIPDFLNELYEVCKKKGILGRSGGQASGQDSRLEEVRTLIGQSEIKAAFQLFDEILEAEKNKEYAPVLLQLMARQSSFEKEELTGTLSFEEKTIRSNAITNDLIKLVDAKANA